MAQKDVHKFWEWVQYRMDDVGIASFRELERKAGLSNGAINSRKNDMRFPTVEMAEGLCRALRVSWVDLWKKAGFVDGVEIDQLTGLDAEIFHLCQGSDDRFKQALIKSMKVWLALYQENKLN